MATLSKILIVDQDHRITDVLALALKNSFDIEIASSGKQAIYRSDIYKYDVIVVDFNLPDISCLALCQQLKQRGLSAPLLIISQDCSVLKKIEMLDGGANDYVTKPFSLGEFKARLRALIRTYKDTQIKQLKPLSRNGVSLNKQSFEVTRNGQVINLRKKEFAILEYLMNRSGIVVSRQELLNSLWSNGDDLWTNTLDVHIKYLRDKIDRPFKETLIHTIHGQGYKFDLIIQSVNKIDQMS
ncbi:MAG TPA: response regulator transcription factor [Patescibacteria group bacterium]|nr:response regulator transcription factor [Patescibacteria group bacterium]